LEAGREGAISPNEIPQRRSLLPHSDWRTLLATAVPLLETKERWEQKPKALHKSLEGILIEGSWPQAVAATRGCKGVEVLGARHFDPGTESPSTRAEARVPVVSVLELFRLSRAGFHPVS
jgi:hypothetical protein